MNKPMVSVIVPVYNVEAYIEKCIESVRAQTFSDWELILVNDGSADNSGALCRAWEKRDVRVRVIEQDNAGVSAARNAGLEASHGEYLFFLDGDDTLMPEALSVLTKRAESDRADITEGGVLCTDEEGLELRHIAFEDALLLGTERILQRFLEENRGLYACWGKLIRRDLLGKTRFAPYTRGEDALFCTELMLRCERYAITGELVYRYLRRESGVMNETFRAKTLDFIRAWSRIYELLENTFPALCPNVAAKVIWRTDRIFTAGMVSGSKEWKTCRRELVAAHRRFYPLQKNCAGGKKRLARLVYAVCPEFYYRLAERQRL